MTMKKCVDFGKINYCGTGKLYPVTVDIELRERGGEDTFIIKDGEQIPTGKKTPVYTELSICGTIWNTFKTDCICAGQCLDSIAEYVHTPEFKKIFRWWKLYHLNGMHAGTPEQEQCIKANIYDKGLKYDYGVARGVLEQNNLLTVPFYGKTIGKEYNGENYTYGHGWVINDIPENELKEIRDYINS